jgi:hypothetical protein
MLAQHPAPALLVDQGDGAGGRLPAVRLRQAAGGGAALVPFMTKKGADAYHHSDHLQRMSKKQGK